MVLYRPPKAATEVPVIDLAGRRSGAAEVRETIAREIHKAARDTGFFYITNHGVDRQIVNGMFSEAIRLLDLPPERKSQVQKRPGHFGWEGLEAQRLDAGSPPDLKESWNCGLNDRGPRTPRSLTNQWPAGLPGFREAVEAYCSALGELGFDLIRLLARSLELDESYFDDAFRNHTGSLRLLRYPPQPQQVKPNQIGAGAHTDYGAITILAQDDLGGLEVQNGDGDWIRADPIPEAFIVNLGDLFPRWTSGAYRSSMHRVMNGAVDRNRHSIVYFYSPAYDAVVSCVPTCIPESGIPLFPPVVAGEYSGYRLAESRRNLIEGA